MVVVGEARARAGRVSAARGGRRAEPRHSLPIVTIHGTVAASGDAIRQYSSHVVQPVASQPVAYEMSPLMTTWSTSPSAVASSTRVTVALAESASPMSAT